MYDEFDVGASLKSAIAGARDRLNEAQRAVARGNSGEATGRAADTAMAQTAQAAIFTEVLLAADRARFEEIKAVTR
jgi:hypothetical protein